MAENTIIRLKRGAGLNTFNSSSNPGGLTTNYLNAGAAYPTNSPINMVEPWFNTQYYQLWIDGVVINPELQAGTAISLGAKKWDPTNTSKVIQEIGVDLNALISTATGNSLSINNNGLFVPAAATGASYVYESEVLTDTQPSTPTYERPYTVRSGAWRRREGSIGEDSDGNPITTWEDPMETTNDGDIIVSHSTQYDFGDMLQWYNSTYNESVANLVVGEMLHIQMKGSGSNSFTTQIPIGGVPRLLRNPANPNEYALWHQGYQTGSFTIPTATDRFAKSVKIITLSGTAEALVDNTDQENPINITAENSAGILGVALVGDKVIRIEVDDDDATTVPNYLYIGIKSLFSFKTLSSSDHESNQTYVIKGSGYSGVPSKYLREDGTWQVIQNFTGATTTTNGTAGLVPAPTTGNINHFLLGDGTWGTPNFNIETTAGNGTTNNEAEIDLTFGANRSIDTFYLVGSSVNNTTQISFGESSANKIKLHIDVIDGGTF